MAISESLLDLYLTLMQQWDKRHKPAAVNYSITSINALKPRQYGHHFADNTFKPIFLNGNIRISIKISLKFVLKVPINNIPALVQIMAWRRPGDKPLSDPMMVCLLTHTCVTRPQWVMAHMWHRWTHPCRNSYTTHYVVRRKFTCGK